MLYTEDFTMRHYVGFSQIGSHMASVSVMNTKAIYDITYNMSRHNLHDM